MEDLKNRWREKIIFKDLRLETTFILTRLDINFLHGTDFKNYLERTTSTDQLHVDIIYNTRSSLLSRPVSNASSYMG